MIVKILKTLLIVFAILTLTACTNNPEPKPIYIYETVEVKVPVKCIVPDVNCSFDRPTDTEVISSLLECIIDFFKSVEVCK